MPMYKVANSEEDLSVSLPFEMPDTGDEVVFYTDLPSKEEVVEMHSEKPEMEISFTLPHLPGAPDEVIEVSDEDLDDDEEKEDNKKEDKKEEPNKGTKDWQTMPKKEFLKWVKEYLNKIPSHKGETIALERTIAYLKRGLDILSKCVQQDFDGEIDISKAEDARVEMESGIERLDKELQKRRKKANSSGEITKEAQKATAVHGIIVTVPLIVSSIARICINSTISGGKSIEDVFTRLAAKWKLTDREKAEVVQLLQDMGMPMRKDRGFMIDDDEKYESASTNNYDYVANYKA